MASNEVVVNGNIKYEVPDSKMKAVDEVLLALSGGAESVHRKQCPFGEVGRHEERRECCIAKEVK